MPQVQISLGGGGASEEKRISPPCVTYIHVSMPSHEQEKQTVLHICVSLGLACSLKTHPFLPSHCEISRNTLTLLICAAHKKRLLDPQHDN